MKPRRNQRRRKSHKKLKEIRDRRELFTYLLQKAHLEAGYGYALWPETGPLRRVVLFSHAFRDSVIDLIEQFPNLCNILRGLEELRLVATKISPKGVARLRQLMPDVKVHVVTDEDWGRNVAFGNASFNITLQKMENPPKQSPADSKQEFDSLLQERYGKGSSDLSHADSDESGY